jgi:hypothetical protein
MMHMGEFIHREGPKVFAMPELRLSLFYLAWPGLT